MTKEDDLQIARALGCYARITGASSIPDAIGNRYRADVEGRRAFIQGWREADMHIVGQALSLICDLIVRETINAR